MKAVLQSLGFGLVLFVVAALVAFIFFTDPLNLLVVWIIYGAAYVVSSLIHIAIIVYKKRGTP
ncbi:hypothetical protein [Paenibacillus sp. YYML68]|uniref:hypothetical protein n=1 Tax=Paenibacillus sp. YYML68 TaxID=2909250 RepID=UPI002490D5D7|nr:hypothetical protein [Paenibacillus sp. YYML68]